MQIICISRGCYGFGSDLSERLADKLGYACVSREMITDKATDYGIPVGKIEIDILKNKPITEERGINIDLFKSFVTSELCQAAQIQGVVYHGRAGHLVLPGLSNVMRVRAIADQDKRIEMAMNKTNLDRKRAKKFLEQTDDDIRRWVRILYNEDWEDPALYDLTINAHHMSAESSAHFLMGMANLPEFQPNPASNQVLEDLMLAARCRLAIGHNEETSQAKVTVKAERGKVSVTYLPRQAREAQGIPTVLEKVSDVKSFICTVASTNILLLGETFDAEAEHMDHLIDIAEKWNAAVEVVHVSDSKEAENNVASPAGSGEDQGGILDDTADAPVQAEGLEETMARLIQVGRAGSSHTTHGGINGVVQEVSKSVDYSLIVIGQVFESKGAAKQRLKRDLVSRLTDKFSCPVLSAEDLKSKYLFGPKQFMRLILSLGLSAVLYVIVFGFQKPLLTFVSAGQTGGNVTQKISAAVAIALFIPLVAFIIGGFYHNFLKLIRLE